MSEFQKMIEEKLYNAWDKDLGKLHRIGMLGCEKINRCSMIFERRRRRLISKYIPDSVGKNLTIFPPFYFEYGINIKVGKECFINRNCNFMDCAEIVLGDNVWIGGNVTLATPVHPYLMEERINQNYPDGYHDLEYAKKIIIGSGTWISSSVTISGGVTIGENSVITAGSVVTSNIPDNSLVGGVPAKVIRYIDSDDRINVWETYIKGEKPLSNRKKKK